MKKPVKIKSNSKIEAIVKHKIINVSAIDFTGDGKLDFICEASVIKQGTEQIEEYWIDSYYKILKVKEQMSNDYNFNWFVNIDIDPEPEIFNASGYSDGIDYGFYDQNLKTGEDTLIFYFNPIINDSLRHDKKYWGYPWDIVDIIITKKDSQINIMASIDHDIKREGEITYSKHQKLIPIILFKGKSNMQYVEAGQIGNISMYSINQLKKLILK